MKAYGLPRHADRDCPDNGDINKYGLSSKHGKRGSKSKRLTRIRWKRKERAKAKKELEGEENES